MKRLILILAICGGWLTNVNADDDTYDICSEYSAAAELIMEARQDGHTLRDVMSTIMIELKKSSSGDKVEEAIAEKLVKTTVIKAYEEPLVNSREERKKVITEFGNFTYSNCIELFDAVEEYY